MHRLLRPFAALVLLVAAAPAALAQAWPTARPIRIIVSASPGTLTDSIGRYYADHLAKAFGQQVIVDNKPGAANLLAMQAAKAAPPDGYTLLLGTAASFTTNPHLMKALPYDPLKDFVPVALLSRPGFAIVVNSKMPVKTLPELVAYAKSRPDGLAVAVDGPRNFTGLSAAYLSKATGAPLRLIPYKNIAQGAQDVAAGTADMVIQGYGLVQGMVTKGDLRPVAVTSPIRLPLLPDVPAVAETYSGFDITGWLAFFAPAGTPEEILVRVNAELDKAIKLPETRVWGDRLYQSVEPQAGTLAQLREFVRSQHDMWGTMVSQIGVQPE